MQNHSVQIVSLGAGFDTTYFNVRDLIDKDHASSLKYIEVDYPAVMSRKVNLAKEVDLLPDEKTQPSNPNVIYRQEI